MNVRYFIFSILLIACLMSCKETADVYLGIPLQPKLEENNYEPGLNIIGVLRPDRVDSISASFVHVQEVAPAIDNYPEFSIDSLLIKSAQVAVVDEQLDTFLFSYTNYEELFNEYQYRPSGNFMVNTGLEYTIICRYKDLPELTSSTVLPEIPEISEEGIYTNGSVIRFSIKPDSSAFLYDVYAIQNENVIAYSRIVPTHNEHTEVELNVNTDDSIRIHVYAYDFNLATYFATSNTSLNFNKYRRTYGNVDGGYGVFGSLNFASYTIE